MKTLLGITVAWAAVLTSGCGGAEPPGSVSVAPAPAEASAPPPMAARWVFSGGWTSIGPRVASRTVVVVGGRRALVDDDGTVREEGAPSPEPMRSLVSVPTGGGPRLAGIAGRSVYRLDEPLGEPRSLFVASGSYGHIGAGPGVAVVWHHGPETARFVDVERGGYVAPFPSSPPPVDVAFRTTTEGVAFLMASGFATTHDGGKTFVAATEAEADAIAAELPTHPSRAGHAPAKRADAPKPPLVRWIEATGEDPRGVAAEYGQLTAPGEAIAAMASVVARVDLETGAIRELASFRAAPPGARCASARVGDGVWLACLPHRPTFPKASLYFVDLRAKPLAARRMSDLPDDFDTSTGALPTDFPVTTAGVAAARVRCDEDQSGCVAALKGDGTLEIKMPFPSEISRSSRWALLKDGRVALTNDRRGGVDLLASRGKRDEVAAVDVRGKARSAGDEDAPRPGNIVGALDQAPDGALRFLSYTDGEIYLVHQRLDGKFTAAKVPNANHVWFGAARDVASGVGGLRTSTDGGATWTAIEAPASKSFDVLKSVTEVGIRCERSMRLGWGPAAAVAARPEPPPLPQATVEMGEGPKSTLVCAPVGPSRSERGVEPPNSLGTAPSCGFSSDKRGWTLRWIDPLAPGATVRSWSGKPPAGAEKAFMTSACAASTDEALFWLAGSGGAAWVARVTPSRIAIAAYPTAEYAEVVAAPPRRGEPAVWLLLPREGDTGALWTWDGNREPRRAAVLAGVPYGSDHVLRVGAPRGKRVPLAIRDWDHLWARWVPLDGDASAPVPPGGWIVTRVPNVDARCTGPAPADAMEIDLGMLRAHAVATSSAPGRQVISEAARLRVGGDGGTCLAAFAGPRSSESAAGGEGFARVDLMAMRADVATTTKEPLRSATCTTRPRTERLNQ